MNTNKDIVSGMYDLVAAQQQILSEIVNNTGNDNTVRQICVLLSGHADLDILKQCWQETVNSNPVCRTSFHWEGLDKPVRFIHDDVDIPWQVIDRRNAGHHSATGAIEDILSEDRETGYNLQEAPLMRIMVVITGDSSSYLLFSYHGILMDASSGEILLNKVFSLYKNRITGNTVNEQTEDEAIVAEAAGRVSTEDQLSYWKNKLSGAPLILDLPTDYTRPAIQTRKGNSYRFAIPATLADQLSTLCNDAGTTMPTVFLSAYSLLLSRYSRQQEILIGSNVNTRNTQQADSAVGFFEHTIVYRTNLEQVVTLADLAGQLDLLISESAMHAAIPFHVVAGTLQKEPNPGYSHIFQATFGFDNTQPSVDIPGLEVSIRDIDTRTVDTDLSLNIKDTSEGQKACFTYNTDLFLPTTIERMAGHYIAILQHLADNPAQDLKTFSILSKEEYRKMVYDWNQTSRAIVQTDKTVLDYITAIAEEYPERIAFEFDGDKLSYVQLEKESYNAACYLLSTGLVPGDRVGLIAHKSIKIVSAILGIMKAGGVYVPVDPDYPGERIKYMLQNSEARLLLSDVPLNGDYNIPVIDYADGAIFKASVKGPDKIPVRILPDAVAYIIYTSGSTGTPKGVMLKHSGLLNMVAEMKEPFQVDENCRTLQFASLSFDTSIAETFTSLYAGGTLVMAPKFKTLPGPDLIHFMQSAAINHVTLPPSVLNATTCTPLPDLKVLVAAGEACNAEIVSTWGKDRTFINAYGPTECTVCAMLTTPCVPGEELTIGRPIGNVVIYILDEHLNPVPAGVPGELWIGGMGVAAGYINLPAQTAERFITDPFSQVPGARMYKTGDLVKYLADGRVSFIGRKDRQFKLRGFRIEPGEIESKLLEIEGTRDAAVVARPNTTGNMNLVGFYTCQETQPRLPDEIRNALSSKLPPHMVPSLLVNLKTMPLTPNNKIDYKWLEHTTIEEDLTDSEDNEPVSEIEASLLRIFKEVLGREKISVSDNFFAIGGDSIIAIQIVSRANAEGIMITLKQIFKEHTISALANVAKYMTPQNSDGTDATGDITLTPVYKWFFEQKYNNISHYNQSLLLNVTPDFDPGMADAALIAIIRHHDMLRLRVTGDSEGYGIHIPEEEVVSPLSTRDISDIPDAGLQSCLMADMNELQASLDVFDGPIILARCYKLPENQHPLLFIAVHHLAIDGVSWRILVEDLARCYQQLSDRQEILLPAKTSSFKSWSEKLLSYSTSPEIAGQIPFWINEKWFDADPIPRDITGNEEDNTTGKALTHTLLLDEDITTGLITNAHLAYNTQINDLLLAALAIAFDKFSNSSRLLLALEGHGREEIPGNANISNTIGWFTSVYPVLLEVANPGDIGKMIVDVKEQLRGIPQNGIGYGLLRYGNTEDDIRHNIETLTQPEIIFNYLGQADQAGFGKSGWSISSIPTGNEQSSMEQRAYLIEINAMVVNGCLSVNWTYCPSIHHTETIEKLSADFESAIVAIVSHCMDTGNSKYTPSDFPDAGLGQDQLDQLFAQFKLADQ